MAETIHIKEEPGLELEEHRDCRKYLELHQEYLKIKKEKTKHEAEIRNLQAEVYKVAKPTNLVDLEVSQKMFQGNPAQLSRLLY